MALGLVAALLGVVAGAVLLWPHSPPKPGIDSSSVLPTTSTAAASPASGSASSTAVASSEASTTAPPPYRGNSVVSVDPAAAGQPMAPAVVDLLSRYFTDINTGRFDDYRLLYMPPKSAGSLGQIAHDYRSTIDTHARLVDLTTAPDGRPEATVTFISTQDAVDGPDGETCTQWQVAFYLETATDGYLIGTPPADYRAQHTAC